MILSVFVQTTFMFFISHIQKFQYSPGQIKVTQIISKVIQVALKVSVYVNDKKCPASTPTI
jgi:hypothetical protein